MVFKSYTSVLFSTHTVILSAFSILTCYFILAWNRGNYSYGLPIVFGLCQLSQSTQEIQIDTKKTPFKVSVVNCT